MTTHNVIEIFKTVSELGESTALFLRLKDGPNYGADAYNSTQALNIDFRGDEDDPTLVAIDPIETIDAVIDEPGALPDLKARCSYTDERIEVDVKGVTFKELVRAFIQALDGNYEINFE